jgi:S-methylmethionine-dependent homocysteine/selenocysteine methylase
LPPLVSSYHAEDVPDEASCLHDYIQLVAAQADGVDLFLCETLTTAREVRTATTAGVASGKPVWASMTVSDSDGTQLRSGEPLSLGVGAAVAAGASALLLNCSWPEAITQGLAVLADSGLPFGAYANGFTNAAALQAGGTVEGLSVRTDLDPDAYAAHAMQWVTMGARLVGGCCEVGPAHIQRLGEVLQAAGFELGNRP